MLVESRHGGAESGVQIAAREPDIRERVVVEVDQAPQLTPMFDGDDELPGTPRRLRPCCRSVPNVRCGFSLLARSLRSWRPPIGGVRPHLVPGALCGNYLLFLHV